MTEEKNILERAEELLSKRYKGGQTVTAYLNFCKRQYEAMMKILPDLLAEARRLEVAAAGWERTADLCRENAARWESEAAKWRQIAIDERFQRLDDEDSQFYPDGDGPDYREQAARELESEIGGDIDGDRT